MVDMVEEKTIRDGTVGERHDGKMHRDAVRKAPTKTPDARGHGTRGRVNA